MLGEIKRDRDGEEVNAENLNLARAPYYIGIGAALAGGYASIPLVFSKWAAKLTNEYAVTTEVPHNSDLETTLEVGMWSWGWMEPPLGTISFFILCMQFSRDQRTNLGLPLFTQRYQETCAVRLEKAFPQYDRLVVRDYARVMAFDTSGWPNAICLGRSTRSSPNPCHLRAPMHLARPPSPLAQKSRG